MPRDPAILDPMPITGIARLPRHRVVFETLLADITAGRLQPGDRIPTEMELARTFSASRSTVARAMRELKKRGLLDRQRGGGTHVAKSESRRVALFTPFAQRAGGLGFIGGHIHAHLSELASQRHDHLRLQLGGTHETFGPERLEAMQAATTALIEQGVSGVFYYPIELPPGTDNYNQIVVDRLRAAGIAVVAVDRDIVSYPQRSEIPLVTYDNRRGGYLLTDHIIKQGCKRIAFIGSPYVSSAAWERMRGFNDAMQDAGLVGQSHVVRKDIHELDAAFCHELINTVKPDAIICKMDEYAAVIGRHLTQMGVQVGREVMLAGFDDQPLAELLPVPLTTIRFPADPFAIVCYERLVAQIDNPTLPNLGQSLIDVELVVRASTGGGRTN